MSTLNMKRPLNQCTVVGVGENLLFMFLLHKAMDTKRTHTSQPLRQSAGENYYMKSWNRKQSHRLCATSQIIEFTRNVICKCILVQQRTVNCQSYWLSLESERVSSSQAHSSLSSVTVEKQFSLIKHRVQAGDRCLAGKKKKPQLTWNSFTIIK